MLGSLHTVPSGFWNVMQNVYKIWLFVEICFLWKCWQLALELWRKYSQNDCPTLWDLVTVFPSFCVKWDNFLTVFWPCRGLFQWRHNPDWSISINTEKVDDFTSLHQSAKLISTCHLSRATHRTLLTSLSLYSSTAASCGKHRVTQINNEKCHPSNVVSMHHLSH